MKTLFMRLKRFFKKRRAGKRRFLRTKRNITQATAEFPDIEEICRGCTHLLHLYRLPKKRSQPDRVLAWTPTRISLSHTNCMP